MKRHEPEIPALIQLPFGKEEFATRREAVLALMREGGLDAVVFSSTANYYYLSGLPISVPLGLFVLVLRADGQGFWIGRRTEMSNVRTFIVSAGWSEIARSITDEEDSNEAFGTALGKLLPANPCVGLELDARTLAPNTVTAVARAISGLEVRNASGLVESLRAVKSAAEIGYLRDAGEMTAAVVKEAVAELRPGETDSGLAARIFSSLARLGSDPQPLTPTVVAGPRSALAHATFSNLPLNPGELITIEIGAVVQRYCTPVYRIAMLGQPSDELRRFHDASRSGLLAALSGIGPGMTSHDADRVVREAIDRAGHLEYFTVRAGYSVGLGFVPSWDEDHIMKLRPNDSRIVKPGMVFHIVPALYKLGTGAACCSNTILVTETGVSPLVPIEPELLIA